MTIGYNYVAEGAPQKGLAYMEEGIKKGSLKRPEDAKLLLGVAQLQSGSRARGLQTLKTLHSRDGPADLASLSILLGQRAKSPPSATHANRTATGRHRAGAWHLRGA